MRQWWFLERLHYMILFMHSAFVSSDKIAKQNFLGEAHVKLLFISFLILCDCSGASSFIVSHVN